jgi:DNA-binding XRE family transcriptional regulator
VKIKTSLEKKKKCFDKIDSEKPPLNIALKLLRRSIGKTQNEYAKIIGITPRTLKEFEQGKANPTVETLTKMFKPFGYRIYIMPARP